MNNIFMLIVLFIQNTLLAQKHIVTNVDILYQISSDVVSSCSFIQTFWHINENVIIFI